MAKPKIEIAKPKIISYFKNQEKKIFKWKELSKIFFSKNYEWNLSQATTFRAFLSYLMQEKIIKTIQFDFPNQIEKRFIANESSSYEIFLSLKPNSYFTHYTAMYLNEITEQIPKTIYLNFEQPKKRFRETELTQEKIDIAFKNNVRVSKNRAEYKDYRVCILNGMHTGRLGVIDRNTEALGNISHTNIERTLIDIAVRPVYAGGVYEVLKAYKMAKNQISMNKLVAILKGLNYVYPYYQAIGFYLDRAGVNSKSQMEFINNFEMKYDFYLTHGLQEKEYSHKWRVFHPKGL